jgi:hypothetical protein
MTIFRHEARGSLPDGEFFTFGIHSSKVAGVIADAAAAWKNAVDSLWLGDNPPTDGINQFYGPSVSVDELVTTELDATTGKNLLQETQSYTGPGTGTGDNLPQEVAVCVSLRTPLPTRAGRGRFFLPSPLLTTCVASRLDADTADAIALAAINCLATMQVATYPAAIYHRSTHTATLITSIDVGDVFDSMRTRRDKLREVRHIQVL